MDEFNLILLLWRVSLFISIVSLVIGIFKRSWVFMLISMVTSIPIAYYFAGAVNAFKYIGFVPVILLALTIYFWFIQKNKKIKKRV